MLASGIIWSVVLLGLPLSGWLGVARFLLVAVLVALTVFWLVVFVRKPGRTS